MKVCIIDNQSGHGLNVGTEFETEIVDHVLQAVSYVWDKKNNLDWWILPCDYKVIQEVTHERR